MERRLPVVVLHGGPAIGQPQSGLPVATIGHKLAVLATRHQLTRDLMGMQQPLMFGGLIVKHEGFIETGLADTLNTRRAGHVAANAGQPLRHFQPVQSWPSRGQPQCGRLVLQWRFMVRRQQRVAREGMENIGEQQLLVLLLVMKPERDERERGLPHCCIGLFYEVLHGCIHMRAVGHDLAQTGARQQAAHRPRMTWPEGLVIRVEQVKVLLVERAVMHDMRLQHHGLEKPAGMRQMPFCRAGVLHRLDTLVFCRQRCRQGHTVRAHRRIAIGHGGALQLRQTDLIR